MINYLALAEEVVPRRYLLEFRVKVVDLMTVGRPPRQHDPQIIHV